jgi:hypothetical protein
MGVQRVLGMAGGRKGRAKGCSLPLSAFMLPYCISGLNRRTVTPLGRRVASGKCEGPIRTKARAADCVPE